MTASNQAPAPKKANNIFITNAASSTALITSLSINGTEMIPVYHPQHIVCGNYYQTNYEEKNWENFDRIILKIKIDETVYAVDLNKDHYFGGGDFHYPGKGSQVNFLLYGATADHSQIKFCLAYGENFNSTGAKRLRYSNDTKYLDKK